MYSGSEEVSPVWVHNTCWDSANDLPPTEPTGITTFDGREILRGPNGERIYQGHDGRFYDANEVVPSRNPSHITIVDGDSITLDKNALENGHKIIGETDLNLSDKTPANQAIEIQAAGREHFAAENISNRADVDTVYLGNEAYNRVHGTYKVTEKGVDVVAEVQGGKFDLADGKGAQSISSGISQLEYVGEKLGANNIRNQELYVPAGKKLQNGYFVEDGLLWREVNADFPVIEVEPVVVNGQPIRIIEVQSY